MVVRSMTILVSMSHGSLSCRIFRVRRFQGPFISTSILILLPILIGMSLDMIFNMIRLIILLS